MNGSKLLERFPNDYKVEALRGRQILSDGGIRRLLQRRADWLAQNPRSSMNLDELSALVQVLEVFNRASAKREWE